jgi:hypothetical protein
MASNNESNSPKLVKGIRNSTQLHYNGYLYNRYKESRLYRCIERECPSSLKVDDNLKIKKEPSKHSLHATIIPCRLAVMLAIQTMKDETVSQPDTKLKVIYDRALLGLTEKFLIGDINSRLIGNLLPYEKFRPTLTSIRGKTVPPQPKDLSSMNFEASEYSEYTKTLENELFLQVKFLN